MDHDERERAQPRRRIERDRNTVEGPEAGRQPLAPEVLRGGRTHRGDRRRDPELTRETEQDQYQRKSRCDPPPSQQGTEYRKGKSRDDSRPVERGQRRPHQFARERRRGVGQERWGHADPKEHECPDPRAEDHPERGSQQVIARHGPSLRRGLEGSLSLLGAELFPIDAGV